MRTATSPARIHLVSSRAAVQSANAQEPATRSAVSRTLYQFPLNSNAETRLEPRPVSGLSVGALALAAIAPVAFWLGHALLAHYHQL